MKKILAVIFLGFFCIGSTYAQIIELDKCIRKSLMYGAKLGTWSEKSFKENNRIYFKFLNEPQIKEYGVNKIVSVSESFNESNLDNLTRKKYIKEGFNVVEFKDKDALTIDTTRGTITTIFSYTDEFWSFDNESHNKWVKASKKLLPNNNIQKIIDFHNERQKTEINKFKITDYVSGIIIGYRTDQERIYPNERYSIKVDLNKLVVSEGYLNSIHNNPLRQSICSNPKVRIKSIKSNKTQTNKKTGTFKSILGNVLGK